MQERENREGPPTPEPGLLEERQRQAPPITPGFHEPGKYELRNTGYELQGPGNCALELAQFMVSGEPYNGNLEDLPLQGRSKSLGLLLCLVTDALGKHEPGRLDEVVRPWVIRYLETGNEPEEEAARLASIRGVLSEPTGTADLPETLSAFVGEFRRREPGEALELAEKLLEAAFGAVG